jgi:hypothetical protein
MYTIHDDVMKSLTPVELRGHKSKGYQGETPVDPSRAETGGSHGETTTSLVVTPPPSHGETVIIKEPTNKTINESKTLADIGKLVENQRIILKHVKSKYYIVFTPYDLNVSNDPSIRLASLYARWIWHSKREDTKAEMSLFASVIRPYLTKYTDPRIASWIRRYSEGISEPKFRSVRKLVETEDSLCWPKRKHWPGLDHHSDFSIEEQTKNYQQMYGEYEQ